MIIKNKPLVVLEVANNHQGDINHGKEIVTKFSEICDDYRNKFEFAIKFQYRNLNTFIHSDYIHSDVKYVRRFLDTQLKESEWKELIDFSIENNFITMCTPFDEDSVDKVVKDGFKILKIASASLDDWPLIEKIGNTNIDIIASVGGANIEKIKRFYHFMKNRNKSFALNYCVSTYPTNNENLNLEYISYLKNIFPEIDIGFSTHEDNQSFLTGALAYAKGARIFEKHIGVENKDKNISINDYSTTPKELNEWLYNLSKSIDIVGTNEGREKYLEKEEDALKDLKRGVFAKIDLKNNHILKSEDLYFAIPSSENQLKANDISKFNNIITTNSIKKNEPLDLDNLEIVDTKKTLENIRELISDLLRESNIYYLKDNILEISHHFGLENFEKFGSTLITLINKEYCKKLIVMLPNQINPEHFHKKKDESFLVISGQLEVNLDNTKHTLSPGEILHIPIGSVHSFSSKDGAVFEEISTTHYKEDSFYIDEEINQNLDRKSYIPLD